MLWLVEAVAYDDDAAAEVTYRWASGGGFTTRPDDSPANTVYDARLIDPGNWEQHLFKSRTTRGRSETALGVITVNNADGALDGLWSMGWGRSVRILMGPDTATELADFALIATHTSVGVERTRTTLRISLKDRQAEVADKPMNATKYAGDNALPDGVEGVEEDLKGRPKPRVFGEVEEVPLPMVNTSKLTLQITDARPQAVSITSVKDQAASPEITAGTSQASISALQAATVTASEYDYYTGSTSDGGFIRLGSSPNGVITATLVEGTNDAARTVAQIVRRILTGPGGLTDSDLDLDSFTALDTANSAVVGLWTGTDDMTVGDALDTLCASVGAFWTVDADGKFAVGRLDAPAPLESVATLTDEDILQDGFELVVPSDTERGIPTYRVIVEYGRIHHVFSDADMAGSVSQADRSRLKQEYRRTDPDDDAAVLLKHPLSKELVITTQLRTLAAAEAERDRLAGLYGVEREIAVVPVSADTGAGIGLNETVTLESTRFGWSSGKDFRLIGRIHEYARARVTLIFWG